MAMEHLQELLVVGVRVGQEGLQRKRHRLHGQLVAARCHFLDDAVVLGSVNGFPFDDVTGLEKHHHVFEVRQVLRRVKDGCGCDAKHLVAMVYRPWSLEGRRIETINLNDVPSMNIGLGWKQGRDPSPAMQAFRDYFKQLFLEPVASRVSKGGR